MKSKPILSRKPVVAAFTALALGALTVTASAPASAGLVAQATADVNVDVNLEVVLGDLLGDGELRDQGDLPLSEIIAILEGLELPDVIDQLPDLGPPEGGGVRDLPGPADLELPDGSGLPGLELGEIIGFLTDGGSLVDIGQIVLQDTLNNVGNNILKDADILNDMDINILNDPEAMDRVLGLVGVPRLADMVPNLGGGGGNGSDADDDPEVLSSGMSMRPDPTVVRSVAAPVQLMPASSLEQEAASGEPVVAAAEVAPSLDSAPSGALPRTGGLGALPGVAAGLLAGAGALSLVMRRRRAEA